MELGRLYFLKAEYFDKCGDESLMKNKSTKNAPRHDRPYLCASIEADTGIAWMVPASSQIDKYMGIYHQKTSGNKACDTITFACVQGKLNAFLVQNMCPACEDDIRESFTDSRGTCIGISHDDAKDIRGKVAKVIALTKQGKVYTYTDILGLYEKIGLKIQCKDD